MKRYQARTKNESFNSNFLSCLAWCEARVATHDVAHVVMQRAGEKKAYIVAEVTESGIRLLNNRPVMKGARHE